MSDTPTTSSAQSPGEAPSATLASRVLRDRAFLVAAGILLVAAVGWPLAAKTLQFKLRKSPAPWPQHVQVDAGFRNISFPLTLGTGENEGRFVRVEEDGVLERDRKTGQPIRDGKPDGETVLESNILETLGMGTGMERGLIEKRCSNWYLQRTYRDRKSDATHPFGYWSLFITYYTGGLDTVPHIGEICAQAAGASIVWEQSGEIPFSMPNLPPPWNQLKIRRVVFRFGMRQYVQYYVFSLNGNPEYARSNVRLELMKPWRQYVYFAKIQIEPRAEVPDLEQADREAMEFLRCALPAALKEMPTDADLKKLDNSSSP